ncbi:MAG: hypothetical protein WC869_00490 [Phycisphaerae bacterium]|jgi:DNA-directed RNA polymerase subunit beta'
MPVDPDAFKGTSFAAVNRELVGRTIESVAKIFPMKTEDGKLEVRATNVKIDDTKHDPYDLNAWQAAREQGGSVTAPVTADLALYRDGKRVQTRSNAKIGELPLMGSTGTFMVGGNDWFTPFAQFRLKPGIYSRQKVNGEYESFMPMQGASMTVWMDPAKGQFKLSHGSTNVGLYPVLKALGKTDEEIIQAWGGDQRARELLEQNKVDRGEKDIDKLFESVFHLKQNRDLLKGGVIKVDESLSGVDQAGKITALKQWIDSKHLDPYVTKKTVGQPIDKPNETAFMLASRKILDVQRGDADPDIRDSPHFKTAHNIADLMAERVERNAWRMQKKLFQRLRKGDDVTLGEAMGPAFLEPLTTGFFGGAGGIEGGMAHTAEGANPLALASEQSKTTFMGPGGIMDMHAVSKESRLFQPGALGFIDPVHSPEGAAVGLNVHAVANARKSGNTLVARFIPVLNGRAKWDQRSVLSVEDANDTTIGYPEFWDEKTGLPVDPYTGEKNPQTVRANRDNEILEVHPTEVKYLLPKGTDAFDHVGNAAGFFANTHPNRGMMAGKHITQALPLVYRELPLSTLKTSDGKDVMTVLGHGSTVSARNPGTVTKITENGIWVDGVKHAIFDRYPMQAKVSIDHTPVVKVGDVVKKGDLLADSNYTKDGQLALGVNLRSAYIPWKNASNYEDAIVISETAAKKLTSDHTHRHELILDEGIKVDPKLFIAQFPTLLTREMVGKLGTDGVVQEGQEVKPGDVLIAAVRARKYDEYDRSAKNLSSIHKMLERPWLDASVKWDEDYIGKVNRIVRSPDKIEIHIQTAEPMRVGDKLSMGSAAKGTIAEITPDHEMPTDEKGRPLEVIFNPHGVSGRINPSQTLEQAVGKLVRDHGVKFDHVNFGDNKVADRVQALLDEHKVKHEERLFDPVEGRHIENPVPVGYNYVYKLDHPVRKKFSARTRDGYTMDEAPTAGRGKGGQSFDGLQTYALLGHNAHAILGESMGVRGAKNDDYWVAYQAGEKPPAPKVPFVFEKLRAMMAASGIDSQQHGNALHFMPMTDANTLKRSNGEIQKASLVRAKDLAEEKGGLFDVATTGGLKGDKWSHIDLGRKVPHPLYEKVIKDLLDLKTADYLGVIGHTRHYNAETGEFSDQPGSNTTTGEAAFRAMLDFDPAERFKEVQKKARTASGSDLNRLNRAARYLKGLQDVRQKPFDAYMISQVPVIPPMYRPVIEQRNGGLRVADSNLLYRDLILTRDTLQKGEQEGSLSTQDLAKARVSLYDAYGALVGVGKSLTHRRDADLRGFVDVIKGKNNKEGLFQQQLSRRRNDYTGRSTIESDATLGPDEAAIPEDMAWKIYQPAIVRRLAQLGWKPADAMREVERKGLIARNALDEELRTRPILLNRAPSLHRWSVLAAMPKIHSGKEVRISPFVLGPFNADMDGDTMSVFAPLSDKGKREAHDLLPSRNLWYDKDRSLAFAVDKDVITGLFALTRRGVNSGKTYPTRQAALDAYKNNKDGLRMDSLVMIDDEKNQNLQAVGWMIFEGIVPVRFLSGIAPPIDGKKLATILDRIAKESPADFNNLGRKLQSAGFAFAARAGGIGGTVQELAIDRTKINALLGQIDRAVKQGKGLDEKRKLALETFAKVKPELDSIISDHLDTIGLGGSVFLAAKPSSKLGMDSYRQMVASPVMVTDARDRAIPSVIKSSYGGGMLLSDYIMATPGARSGMVDKGLSVAGPGFLTKELAGNLGPVRIEIKDCGTQEGIQIPLDPPEGVKQHDADLLDRHLLHDIPGTSFKRNDVVTPEMLAKMRDAKVTSVMVRSPMTCEADSPPCQMCAGRTPDGKVHPIGANIGYNYGMTIGERSTQLTLKKFHSGGTVGQGSNLADGFARLRELLAVPETVKGQGTLADSTGMVTSVKTAPQGGHYIHIRPEGQSPGRADSIEHYVLPGRNVAVVEGEKVKRGDRLSDGSYRPQEIAEKQGLLAAQSYVVDEMRKAFQQAGAIVRKPVLEVAVAAMMRFMRITNDGGEKDLMVGQILAEQAFKARQLKNPKIQGTPELPGLSHVPLVRSNDMLERLNFQRLEDTLREIPAQGGVSDLSGAKSPIPGFAYGAAFRPGQASFELTKDRIPQQDSAFNRLAHFT